MTDTNSIIAKAQAYADSLQQRAEAFVATLQNVAQPTDPLVIASGPGLSIQAATFVASISAIRIQLNGQTLHAPAIVTPNAMVPTVSTNADLGLTSIATPDLTNLQMPDFTTVAPALNPIAGPQLADCRRALRQPNGQRLRQLYGNGFRSIKVLRFFRLCNTHCCEQNHDPADGHISCCMLRIRGATGAPCAVVSELT